MLEIDNKAAERSLRCVALGRKNYLFAGSDAGGERAATIYSLLSSAKLNDCNPEAYLREVPARIADHPIKQIAELLPWNLKAAKATAAQPVLQTADAELCAAHRSARRQPNLSDALPVSRRSAALRKGRLPALLTDASMQTSRWGVMVVLLRAKSRGTRRSRKDAYSVRMPDVRI